MPRCVPLSPPPGLCSWTQTRNLQSRLLAMSSICPEELPGAFLQTLLTPIAYAWEGLRWKAQLPAQHCTAQARLRPTVHVNSSRHHRQLSRYGRQPALVPASTVLASARLSSYWAAGLLGFRPVPAWWRDFRVAVVGLRCADCWMSYDAVLPLVASHGQGKKAAKACVVMPEECLPRVQTF